MKTFMSYITNTLLHTGPTTQSFTRNTKNKANMEKKSVNLQLHSGLHNLLGKMPEAWALRLRSHAVVCTVLCQTFTIYTSCMPAV